MFEIISASILPLLILIIITTGIIKKVPIYEEFVEGAKDGFKVSISIIPYLVAIIVCISMFRASGAIDLITSHIGVLLEPPPRQHHKDLLQYLQRARQRDGRKRNRDEVRIQRRGTRNPHGTPRRKRDAYIAFRCL